LLHFGIAILGVLYHVSDLLQTAKRMGNPCFGIKAVSERLPQAQIVFDRFHVQSLVSDALDEVRRTEVRALPGEHAKTVKKTPYPLLKNPWNLTRKDQQKLADLQRNNARLYRAYLLKEAFAKALDYRQPKRAREAMIAMLFLNCGGIELYPRLP